MTQTNPIGTTIASPSAPQALQGSKTGVLSGGGLNFLDFILSLTVTGDDQKTKKEGSADTLLASLVPVSTPVPGENEDDILAEGELLLASLTPIDNTEVIAADPLASGKPLNLQELALLLKAQDEKIPVQLEAFRIERIQKKITAAETLLDRLTQGLPEEYKGKPFVEFFITRLEGKITALEARLDELQDGSSGHLQALIAIGLSPAQITTALKRIDDLENKLGREITAEDIMAGVGGLGQTPQKNQDVINQIDSASEPTDDLAEQLNGLSVGAGTFEEPAPLTPDRRSENILNTLLKYQGNTPTAQNVGADNASAKLLSLAIPAGGNMSSAQGTSLNKQGFVTLPAGWSDAFTEAMESLGIDIHSGIPMTQASQAAHSTTGSVHAGQAHHATHMVAAQLTKSAKEGRPNVITLELDPPELGRVEVKLEFGSDQSVKAVLTSEKPETHFMLQRDAAFLERALHSAGLTVTDGGIDFQLATDSGGFDQFTKDDGQGGSGKSGRGDDTDVIQSTMTWNVDSETGFIRYNILA
ncbi:MAG: flagellar hook-length control protein FliK [Alphaproteobacteria bacterium]|nr:flagellar hook-length control protein FliK [Alphaproteobacteria bacterium]